MQFPLRYSAAECIVVGIAVLHRVPPVNSLATTPQLQNWLPVLCKEYSFSYHLLTWSVKDRHGGSLDYCSSRLSTKSFSFQSRIDKQNTFILHRNDFRKVYFELAFSYCRQFQNTWHSQNCLFVLSFIQFLAILAKYQSCLCEQMFFPCQLLFSLFLKWSIIANLWHHIHFLGSGLWCCKQPSVNSSSRKTRLGRKMFLLKPSGLPVGYCKLPRFVQFPQSEADRDQEICLRDLASVPFLAVAFPFRKKERKDPTTGLGYLGVPQNSITKHKPLRVVNLRAEYWDQEKQDFQESHLHVKRGYTHQDSKKWQEDCLSNTGYCSLVWPVPCAVTEVTAKNHSLSM